MASAGLAAASARRMLLAALAKLRRLRAGRDVPIIFLTACDEVEDRLRGFHLGADDYLVKPFALEELLARLPAVMRPKEHAA